MQRDTRLGLKRPHAGGTPPSFSGDTRSETAKSTGSGASCSSYTGFGPRKGRRVVYDQGSPATSDMQEIDKLVQAIRAIQATEKGFAEEMLEQNWAPIAP